MRMVVDKLVGLRFHVIFYTGAICQYHKHLLSKVIVGLKISIIGSVREVWDKVLLKLIASFDGTLIRKKVF